MKNIMDLFYSFLKVGFLGYGGGHSILPLIQAEAVDINQWLSMAEFTDALALSDSLPGPIAAKMSIFIGYKVAGVTGAGISLIGLLFPSSVLLIMLASLYLTYKDLPAVKGLLKGVRPVMVSLLLIVVYNMYPTSITSWHTGLIAIISFLLAIFFNIHPAALILGGALLGCFIYR